MAAPYIGRTVQITGLSSKPELNGTQGVAEAYDTEKMRYTIKLTNGQRLALKMANLQVIPEAGDEGSANGFMPGFGAAMPGMAGLSSMLPQLNILKARIQQLLPPGISLNQALIGAAVTAFMLYRIMGINVSVVLLAAAYFVYQHGGAEYKRSGGGYSGVLAALKASLDQLALFLSNCVGFKISSQIAGVLLLGAASLMMYSSMGKPRSTGSRSSSNHGPVYDAYMLGYADATKGRPRASPSEIPFTAQTPAPARTSSSMFGGGMGNMFNMAMIGSMLWQMGARPGGGWSPQQAMMNLRHMSPIQMIMLFSMLSSFFR